MPPRDPAEAAVFAGRAPGSTQHAIDQVMGGLANNYRDPKWVANPNFDPRPRARSGAGGVKEFSNLYRGYITQLRKEVYGIGGEEPKRRRVNFQFNPTQISLNYSINTDAFPQESRASEDTAPILAAAGQTLSWTLYFNRTYETMTGTKKVGVMADIQSMEYLLGSKGNGEGVAAVECMVVFGMTKSGKPLAFAGWISDLNITFLQFTHRMIPTVAMVEVGMVRRFVSADAGPDGGSTTQVPGVNAPLLPFGGVNPNGPLAAPGGVNAAPRSATPKATAPGSPGTSGPLLPSGGVG